MISTQAMTWVRELRAKEAGIPNLQYENSYEYGKRHPFGLPDFLESSWHPQPCKLNLKFSHAGEWIKIPKVQGDSTGPDYSEYHIGRLERYIDIKGIVRKAVAYGKDSEAMNTWYYFDEIKKALGTWVIPQVPFWYNNKK